MLAAGERVRRALAMTIASVGALATIVAPATVAPVVGAAAVEGDGAGVPAIAAVDPVLSEGDDLVVEVEVAAATAADRAVELQLASRPVATRTEFSRWLDGGAGPFVSPVADATLRAGSTSVEITVPADEVPIPEGFAGAFALSAIVSGEDAPVRSFVTVDLDGGGPTGLALSMPSAAPTPSAAGLLDAAQLEEATSEGGALSSQLAIAEQGVAIGIDPLVPASIAALGDDAPESATAWMAAVGSLPETFETPYAGGDPLAIARSGAAVPELAAIPGPDGALLPATLAQVPTTGAPVVDATGSTVDDALLDALDGDTVVVDTGALGEVLESQTPSAHVRIDGRSMLAADEELQRLVEAAVVGDGVATRDGASRALALLATITREAPALQRTLVATIPADADPDATLALLDPIADAAWLEDVAVADAIAQPARDATLTAGEPTGAEVEAAERVATIVEVGAGPEALASTLAEPDDVLAPLRVEVLAAVGTGSRQDGQAAVDALRQAVAPFAQPARILDGSDALIVSSTADLLVTVENRLDVDLSLELVARTGTATVVVSEEPIAIDVPAASRERIAVPAEVVASGSGVVRVIVTTPEGVEIDRATLRITAQPALETILLAIVGAAAALLLGFGIWRSIRKRRLGQAQGDMDVANDRVDDAEPPGDGGREHA